jgi:hypothetical protein
MSNHSASGIVGNNMGLPPSSGGVVNNDEESVRLVSVVRGTNIEIPASAVAHVTHTPTNAILRLAVMTFWEEVWVSTELLFQSRLTWLLVLGPIALLGDSTGFVGEATCFTCAGLALIPCAER